MMAIKRLMEETDSEGTHDRPYINTGGPLDIQNAQYVPSIYGGFALSGGLGITNAAIAEANKHKSTVENGSLVNALARFPDADLFLCDSEHSQKKKRLAGMSSLYLDNPVARESHLADLESRIRIYDPTTSEGETLEAWFEFMKDLRDKKLARKDLIVETEILDIKTGKPYRMMLPTFIGIDSWTEAQVREVNVNNEEFDENTEMSKQLTINMKEGWQKVRLMRQLPSLCAKANFYLGMTGHLGKKFALGTTPPKKDMAFMKQDETAKGMGNKFLFLMAKIDLINNSAPILDKNDRFSSDYPPAAANELQELVITLIRSKNSPSGAVTRLVSSQYQGIQNGLSYYHNLREAKYFGLGSPNKVRTPLLGDLNIGRTKIFDLAKQYEVERALELVYQLFVVHTTWSKDQPVDYSITPEELAEKLEKSSYAVSDILNSRGWWTYTDAKPDRPLLTLPDILGMLDGSYVPKHFPVSSATSTKKAA